ncbi:MAG: RNA-directed DNA polymerase [Patescibacteria group bacterium]
MPIGNLTSQIFANIYLNEFDRFVKHTLGAKAYLRYGDDFIIVESDLEKLNFLRAQAVDFLRTILKLTINPKSDKIFKAQRGLKFLGVILWPHGRKLNKRNVKRVREKLALNNVGSYYGVMKYHANAKKMREFHWLVGEKSFEMFVIFL